MVMKKIIASGPVIIEKGKLLVIRDDKDAFYKIPGGTQKKGEGLERTCMREVREEINAQILITKKLSTLILNENPTTHEKMRIELHHYLSSLLNPKEIRAKYPIREIRWLDIREIKNGRYSVAPNIEYLIEKGEIK
jgi:ADP-ribose pyrophosphatase YjhB (NUDIX family)